MAKEHWLHSTGEPVTEPVSPTYGCQHSECDGKATWQWQREATEEEIAQELRLESVYGEIVRNPQGPHNVAVFACDEHTPKDENGNHNLDSMAMRHAHHCPAPDAGCDCG